MSKKCPNCLEVYDDNHAFCSNCGSRLVDDVELDPILNFGDANAISGGVNINRSKNITSHDTHYHTTTVNERTKSDSELKLEAINQLRSKAERIIAERGRIDSVAMGQLRPLASQLGIDDETFKSTIKEVRSNRSGTSSGLSAANARYLLQARQAVQTNDMDSLSNLTPRLEAMAAISLDDNVQYLYYLTLSLLYPIKSMEVFEHQTDENYWRSFWAIISYVRTGKYEEATKVLALFEPLRFEKSEEDQNILEAYFNIMKEDKDGAQEFLDEILDEPSEQLKPLLRAIEVTLYEEDADSLEVRFYYERVLSKSDVVIKTSKKIETITSKEEIITSSIKEEKVAATNVNLSTDKTQPKAGKNSQVDAMYSEACSASGPKRVMLLQRAAEAGSRDAMYDLSDCYIDGNEVAKNEELAVKWVTKAADLGHPLAQAALGCGYFLGTLGVEQNYSLSEKYLKMAADKNLSEAQAYLSILYLHMEEYNQALVWARKAAQASNSEAYSVLGDIYLKGLGVDSNPAEGLKWYEMAAKNGNAEAQNITGNLYSDKNLGLLDLGKAFKYYQMAATQNHMYGMYNLGLCYETGDGCDVDMLKAFEWIEKAASEGCPEAQEWLANNSKNDDDFVDNEVVKSNMTPDEEIDYANNLFNNDEVSKAEECVQIYKKYANDGIARTQFSLACCYHCGFGVKQNYQHAAMWYKKAAEQGFAPAQLCLGLKYDEGHGCGVNCQEAAKWYRKAAEQNDAEAQFRLGLLYINGHGVSMNKNKGLDLIQKAAEQNFEDATKWLKEYTANLNNLSIDKVWVDTDGVGQLFIHCDWVANNMKDVCLEIRANLYAKTGKKIRHDASDNQWYYMANKVQVKSDASKFTNTCFAIPYLDFNMEHNVDKKIEFYIEIYKWGTNKCVLSSKKMTFTLWFYFNFFKKNKFEIRSQQC